MKKISKITLVLTILSGLLFSFLPDTKPKKEIIAYYSGDAATIDNYNTSQLTQIIYSFLRLRGNRLVIATDKDDQTISKLVSLKKENPELKVLISLGGWAGCETCSDIFSSEKNRTAFAKSVDKILMIYGADGIDLDWEYPAIEGAPGHAFKPEDKQNFTALVQELRTVLGEDKIISFAAGAHPDYMNKSIEWDKVMPLVNNVNLMTYDLMNGYSPTTGHHTSLNKTPQQTLSAEATVNYLDSLGVPLNKMVIGAAFYARVWNSVANKNNGLYQKGTFDSSVSYKDLDLYLNNFDRYYDELANAPYAYNPKSGFFATYDDPKSVAKKCDYVFNKDLKGIMFWELTIDKPEYGLLDEIYKSFARLMKK